MFNQAALDGRALQTVVSSGTHRDQAGLKRVLLRTHEGSLKVFFLKAKNQRKSANVASDDDVHVETPRAASHSSET